MGFMSKWEDGSRWLWNKYGKKIQPAYDKVDNWKTPDWAKAIFKTVWEDLIDEKLKKKLYKLVMEICKDYDDEFAKELLAKVVDAVKKFTSKI